MIAENKSLDQLDDVGGSGRLLPYCEFDIGKNDVLYMRMSSGGGYGDPLEREPERVLNDVENGIVSREEAKEIYGVVIEGDDLVLDLAVTDKLRASLRQERLQERNESSATSKSGDYNSRRDGMGSLQQVSTQTLPSRRGLAAIL